MLEALQDTKGEVARLSDIYQMVHQHPETKKRMVTNANIEPKLRQQLQVLVRQGLVNRVAPGRYRLAVPRPDRDEDTSE